MRFGPASQPKETSPFRGILWTAAFAVAVLIIVYGGSSLLRPRGEEEVGTPPLRHDAPKPPVLRTGHEIDTASAASLSPVLTDPRSLTEATESEALDTDGFYYLLYQSKIADEAKLAAEAAPVPAPDKVAELKPGTPVRLAGTVVSVNSRIDLAIRAAAITEPGQYEIKDSEGNLYLVFTTYRVLGVEAGDKVKVITVTVVFHLPGTKQESAKRTLTFSKYVKAEIVASVTNVYNRANIFYFDRVRYQRVNQLPILPSLSMTVQF